MSIEELREIQYTMAHCHNEKIYRMLAQQKKRIESEMFCQNPRTKGILKQDSHPVEHKTVQISSEKKHLEGRSRLPKPSNGQRQRRTEKSQERVATRNHQQATRDYSDERNPKVQQLKRAQKIRHEQNKREKSLERKDKKMTQKQKTKTSMDCYDRKEISSKDKIQEKGNHTTRSLAVNRSNGIYFTVMKESNNSNHLNGRKVQEINHMTNNSTVVMEHNRHMLRNGDKKMMSKDMNMDTKKHNSAALNGRTYRVNHEIKVELQDKKSHSVKEKTRKSTSTDSEENKISTNSDPYKMKNRKAKKRQESFKMAIEKREPLPQYTEPPTYSTRKMWVTPQTRQKTAESHSNNTENQQPPANDLKLIENGSKSAQTKLNTEENSKHVASVIARVQHDNKLNNISPSSSILSIKLMSLSQENKERIEQQRPKSTQTVASKKSGKTKVFKSYSTPQEDTKKYHNRHIRENKSHIKSDKETISSQHKIKEKKANEKIDKSRESDITHFTKTENNSTEIDSKINIKSKTVGKSYSMFTKKGNIPDGEIMFHLDLDKKEEKVREKKRLSDYFRKRKFRRKSLSSLPKQQEISTISNFYLKEEKPKVRNITTQTEVITKDQMIQTEVVTNSIATQFNGVTTEAATQVSPSINTAETQTVDEDNPLWNGRGVSLDRLIRSKGKRQTKRRLSRSKSAGEIETEVNNTPSSGNKHTINTYNWSQTAKFVKVVVSYSGIHLNPSNKIDVATNGTNLILTIKNKNVSSTTKPSNNQNNNNNSLVEAFPPSIASELNIPGLYSQITGVSYTVQADMITLLLRKRKLQNWQQLTSNKLENTFL